MFTITISGFKTKEEVIEWLDTYECGGEQYMAETASVAIVDMDSFIPEMEELNKNKNKNNFNLNLEK